MLNELTKQEITEAFSNGVSLGIRTYLEGLHLSILSESIREGVSDALTCDVNRTVQKAIENAMPYESQILMAISSGCEEGVRKSTRREKCD